MGPGAVAPKRLIVFEARYRYIRRLRLPGWEIHAPSSRELDLADPGSVVAAVSARKWDAIINAGAYTAVDRAEQDVVRAWAVNALGPAALARAAADMATPLIQLSTDYVFDGRQSTPYVESDEVHPLNVYGASKLGGELAVRTANRRHVIIRSAWIVSATGANFVKTMLRLGSERSLVRVVDDQVGCPTNAADIAVAVAKVTERLIDDPRAPTGTYHFAGDGAASWYDLAKAIFATAEALGMKAPELQPVGTVDYPTPAARPRNSVLNTNKITRDFGVVARAWPVAIREVVEQLASSANVGA